MKDKIWIATGGTGGHIFPALAVADELLRRGFSIVISTDGRGAKYVKQFKPTIPPTGAQTRADSPARGEFGALTPQGGRKRLPGQDRQISRVRIWAAGVGAKSPLFQLWSLFKISVSIFALSIRFIFSRPKKIVAFGGYASVPVLVAGRIFGIPTFLHEQNAVIGRANKFALPFVKVLMASFPIGRGVYTGLPVRKSFTDIKREAEPGRILITGGSLGAAILDEVVPLAVAELKDKKKLFVVHQTRPENVEKLRKIYASLGVKNNVFSFIKDMAGELSKASLVICRAGASTVAEMQSVGVPAVLVPLGINPDQLANANAFAKNGGGIVIPQRELSVQGLAKVLFGLAFNSEKLEKMAKAAYVENKAVSNIINILMSN